MTWQTELMNRYPDLFSRADETERSPGYPTVGDGWQVLVEKAVARIADAVARQRRGAVKISQVKEKFGGLRVYVQYKSLPGPVRKEVREAVEAAEDRSWCTCEICGAVGRLYDSDGTLTTRCELHAIGRPVQRRVRRLGTK